MNNDVMRQVLRNYFAITDLYVVTLLDKKCGYILLQKIVFDNELKDTIYNLATYSLMESYDKRDFECNFIKYCVHRYRLNDIYEIPICSDLLEPNIRKICIEVKRFNLELS